MSNVIDFAAAYNARHMHLPEPVELIDPEFDESAERVGRIIAQAIADCRARQGDA